MFSTDAVKAIATQAMRIGVEPAALVAVADVESGGQDFAIVDGRQEPVIRFEGHYFDRRLSAANRTVARAAGLSSPSAGGVINPSTQAGRWRLLARAAMIDRTAAYESVSWGIGQVMGAHWAWLGYSSIQALVEEARGGVEGQARLMATYIEKSGLAKALHARDWASFARGYNGPLYKRHGYDAKIAAAYERYRQAEFSAGSAGEATRFLLRRGSRGESVRDLQRMLTALGYPLEADGIFGPATLEAVRSFQKKHRMFVDGVADELTYAAVEASLVLGGQGRLSWLKELLKRGSDRLVRRLATIW